MQHIVHDFSIALPLRVEDLLKDENAYKIPNSFESFHGFPEENGWSLEGDKLYPRPLRLPPSPPSNPREPGPGPGPGPEPQTSSQRRLGPAMQAWLFFGLIFTIVQEDDQPILTYADLVDDGGITTARLGMALETWYNFECRDRAKARFRMMRVNEVLAKARKVVRTTLGLQGIDKQSVRNHTYPLDIPEMLPPSLMILGETLSQVKALIVRAICSEDANWHDEDGDGWGIPPFISLGMQAKKWCPWTQNLWEAQLRSQATLLMASYDAYTALHGTPVYQRFCGDEHMQRDCTEAACLVDPEDDQGNYTSAHAVGCDGVDCGSVMYGPDMDAVYGILRRPSAGMPLVRFKDDSDDNYELEVVDAGAAATYRDSDTLVAGRLNYATISHVWSGGLGNTAKNEIYTCQLRFIKRQLGSLKSRTIPFWMDTLVIPVDASEDIKRLRKIAIGKIYDVFVKARYSLALDLGLMNSELGDYHSRPAKAAVKIMSSEWMRRLWTLQEAFLSHEIYFVFAEDHDNPRANLVEFSTLSGLLNGTLGPPSDTPHEVGSARNRTLLTHTLLGNVDKNLRRSIMDHDRELRKQAPDRWPACLHEIQAATMLANVWKAAKWRTTTNPSHEILALATLVNLDYRSSGKIQEAGLRHKPKAKREPALPGLLETQALWVDFWTIFNQKYPRSIPPGIIFLSDHRLLERGFGWAPGTWMSTEPIVHPDPISVITKTASLDLERGHGLRVSFAGFLLYSSKMPALDVQNWTSGFVMTPNKSLAEWYLVEPIDGPLLEINGDYRNKPLGIILPDKKPTDETRQVALLVQVWSVQMKTVGELSDPRHGEKIFLTEIVRRVKISRLQDAEKSGKVPPKERIMRDAAVDDMFWIAEELDSSQVWYVDGYCSTAARDRVPIHSNPLDALLPSEELRNVRSNRGDQVLNILPPDEAATEPVPGPTASSDTATAPTTPTTAVPTTVPTTVPPEVAPPRQVPSKRGMAYSLRKRLKAKTGRVRSRPKLAFNTSPPDRAMAEAVPKMTPAVPTTPLPQEASNNNNNNMESIAWPAVPRHLFRTKLKPKLDRGRRKLASLVQGLA